MDTARRLAGGKEKRKNCSKITHNDLMNIFIFKT